MAENKVRLVHLSLCAVLLMLLAPTPAATAAEGDPDQLLTPESTQSFGRFGWRTATDADHLVVGYSTTGPPKPADFDDEFVHIYSRKNNEWVESASINQPFPGFGSGGLDVDGDWLAIANQFGQSGAQCGRVRMFRLGPTGPELTQTLTSGVCDSFGASVILDGDHLAVSDNQSNLYLFRFNGASWELLDTEPNGGRAADLNGGLLAAMSADESTPEDNGVLLYEVTAGGLGIPILLNPSADSSIDHCRDAAIGLSRIVVGCPFTTFQGPSQNFGGAFLFERSGDTWIETDVLVPSNGFGILDQFGASVDVDGDRILVGAESWTDDSSDSSAEVGAIYLYEKSGATWVNTAFFAGEPAGLAATSTRGHEVHLNGDQLIAGDPSYARIGTVAIYSTPSGRFQDDEQSVFENAIEWLAETGITSGCNPPLNTEFCPNGRVTRGQMAAFLVRALGYSDDGGGDIFVDDDNSIFESAIDKLATAGVTLGCNPLPTTATAPTITSRERRWQLS